MNNVIMLCSLSLACLSDVRGGHNIMASQSLSHTISTNIKAFLMHGRAANAMHA